MGLCFKKRTNWGAFSAIYVFKNRDFPNEFRGKFQTFFQIVHIVVNDIYYFCLKMFQISIMASLLVVLYIWFPEFLQHVSCVLVYVL